MGIQPAVFSLYWGNYFRVSTQLAPLFSDKYVHGEGDEKSPSWERIVLLV
jgi:hypothetical protein